MIKAVSEINKLLSKSKSNTNLAASNIYILMRDLHQPFSDIMQMPIPLALELLKIWEKEQKEKEKAYKKK